MTDRDVALSAPMPTFVEEVQTITDAGELRRRLADRIDALGDALDLLETWTEESRETQTELASKYDTAKQLARDEIRNAADGEDPSDISAVDLLDHAAVDDQTKRRLQEYSTKLSVYLNEEESYGAARSALLGALDDELDLYGRLLPELETGETTPEEARQRIARFARDDALGPPNRTAADVVLEAEIDAA
ncbi:hypothetical protein M0R89_00390 [Halorussus limi]|uniref:Uncharacterized protein n=1 Tax=Halorussus limi TaxID=2938695 RepID=A0A8U0HUY3_9EURY|nr:hypothetical protein [Halorussus limi]UPV74543.1 hypothetical protein M0R89_00390 [Halorussus limi]